MRVISQGSMRDDRYQSVFSHWEPYEIPVDELSMPETEDVVERFSADAPVLGPMRSPLAQLAAEAVQSIVELDPTAAVGALEKPNERRRTPLDRSLNEPLPEVVVLADITIPQYWRAMDGVLGSSNRRARH